MLQRLFVAGCVAAALTACGGAESLDTSTTTNATPPAGSQPPSPAPAPSPTPAPQPAPAPPPSGESLPTLGACDSLTPMPTKPSNARTLAQFGILPSDTKDQGAAIQAAMDALKPGEWLVFPAGKYLHARSLRLKVANTTLWSDGATLVATNPADTALALQADGTSAYGFRLHTVTDTRRSGMFMHRLLVTPLGSARVRNVTLRRNIIENGGAPGTSLANGSSATGIFVYHADNFLIAENTVKRSLADAIHMTSGSINGRVILNTVRENGDDMIASVSYMGPQGVSATTLASNLSTLLAERLNKNILITRNDVSGQYWGRGITVVGGQDITIQNNKIANTTHGAGVLLAREASYTSFGVHNIVVRNNDIQHVQTTDAAYAANGRSTTPTRTGHGGIEIQSYASAEETAHSTIGPAIRVDRILVENNTVNDTLADGIRVGPGGGQAGLIGLVNNQLSKIGKSALNLMDSGTTSFNVFCSGNKDDGNATSHNYCMGSKPAVTGASLTCSTT
ncbi:MAG TPA: right-handed parallel beta-helix repeat-containing protein [Burkholderiaceae bacterium]|nr:right-handed parallel beta-helix repeat-containing protein [Burkholderiaceae bacterium]